MINARNNDINNENNENLFSYIKDFMCYKNSITSNNNNINNIIKKFEMVNITNKNINNNNNEIQFNKHNICKVH